LLNRIDLQQDDERIPIGMFQFNKLKQTLVFNSESQVLTHREAQLLFHLSEKRNDVLDRAAILMKLWGEDDFFNARSMDVFISKLRKKLKLDPNIQIINVRGLGYKLVC
jgi:DNA-binding response OmpR family regulator